MTREEGGGGYCSLGRVRHLHLEFRDVVRRAQRGVGNIIWPRVFVRFEMMVPLCEQHRVRGTWYVLAIYGQISVVAPRERQVGGSFADGKPVGQLLSMSLRGRVLS